MDIAPYIADLLRQHDEVNVPSLGTFYKKQKSGFYDQEQGLFFPPSYGLDFRETADNDFLATHISQQKNISLNTASYFIEKFVMQVQSLLATYGHAEIDNLGTLKKSKDGYTFVNSVRFDDQDQHFGLLPVKEMALHDLTIPVADVSAPVPEAVVEVEAPVEVVASSETPAEEITKESKKVSSISKIILIAASIILIGIVSYLIYPQAFESFRQNTGTPEKKLPAKQPVKAEVPMTLADSVAEADTIYQQLAKQGFEIEKPRDTLEVSTEVKAADPVLPAVTFEIIGAAFARRTEAESYVKSLTAKGVYARIVENMPGSKLKISLGTFNDEKSAQTGLIRIQKELNKDAWIARVKQKKTN